MERNASDKLARALLNKSVMQQQRYGQKLKLEKEIQKEKDQEINKLKAEVLRLRHVIVEATGGLTINTYEKGGENVVQIKNDLDDEGKFEVEVNVLTEILRGAGVLELVLAKVRK